MLLIDATYIVHSGGLVLLSYLYNTLEARKRTCFFLLDSRCSTYFDCTKDNIAVIDNKEKYRKLFYQKNKNRFDKVLCLANVPPPIRLKSEVYTYFHNIYLLHPPIGAPLKKRLLFHFKKTYIKLKNNNTDHYLVQTDYVKQEVCREFKKETLVVPFYEEPQLYINNRKTFERKGYIYAANYHENKRQSLLIKAWIELARKGIKPTLHLTMGKYPEDIELLLREAIEVGAIIINHGLIKRDEVFRLCSLCEATVYPSVGESFGLGIVEAMECGCDVIGPDLPYIHTICKPSCTFVVDNLESLVQSVELYEKGVRQKTVSKTHNEINKLISILS